MRGSRPVGKKSERVTPFARPFSPELLAAMKRLIFCVLLLDLLRAGILAQTPAPFPGWPGKSSTAQNKVDYIGQWEGHVTDGDGSNPGQRRMNITLTITEDRITSGGQGNMMGEGTYKVTGGGKLRRIDATGTAGQYQGKRYEGIFSVEGDTLKWCAGNPGKGRPSELRTNTGSGFFLMVLKRKP